MTKRLILITIDCLRRDRLNVYNNEMRIAPNLDKISNSANIFNNAIANGPNTPTSFYAMFTSNYPYIESNSASLSSNKKTITEILQNNRVKTCAIHSNPHLGKHQNYHRGFDDFIDVYSKKQLLWKGKKNAIEILKILDLIGIRKQKISRLVEIFKLSRIKAKILRLLSISSKILSLNMILNKILNIATKNKEKESENSLLIKRLNYSYSNAIEITNETIKWLQKHYNSNFFLWIHYMDVHAPYSPPSNFIKNFTEEEISSSKIISILTRIEELTKSHQKLSNKDIDFLRLAKILYNAEVNFVDYYLGILFNYLIKKNIFDDVNVIITADHGEGFFEHNFHGHEPFLYDELIRIPLILKLEKPLNKQNIVNTLVETLDLAPTILDIFNLPKDKGFKGKSIIPMLEHNDRDNKNKYIISIALNDKSDFLISCRTTEWKLIFNIISNKYELYNLKFDPKESNNLWNEEKETLNLVKKQFSEEISKFIKEYNTEELKLKRSIERNISKFIKHT